jgi:hypothetical protein
MKLLAVLAATAVAAAVAAALTIPAGADESPDAAATKIVTCLRAHGADIAADADPLAVKTWLASHSEDAAVNACVPEASAPADLVACLRSHGLNPPSSLFELKPWMAQQNDTDAGKAALRACGVDMNPPEQAPVDDQKFATCMRDNGADIPAGADGVALKTWIHDHSGDAKVMDALKACSGGAKDDAKQAATCGGDAQPAPESDGDATPKQ